MKGIVVVDKNWGIGKEGGLLTHLPGDLKYFKEKTLGKIIVMGRKTLESLPGKKPLPGRTTIVLTKDKTFQADCTICYSMEELFQELGKYPKEDIFVAGGAAIYEQLLPYCDSYFVTKMEESFEADRYLNNLDLHEEFLLYSEGEPQVENGVQYKFIEYRRK